MPPESLTRYLLLPELRWLKNRKADEGGVLLFAEKTSEFEVCPRCATVSRSVYDHRWVKLRDDPIRDDQAFIWVRKRRFICRPCRRPFTEPIEGVRKGLPHHRALPKKVALGLRALQRPEGGPTCLPLLLSAFASRALRAARASTTHEAVPMAAQSWYR